MLLGGTKNVKKIIVNSESAKQQREGLAQELGRRRSMGGTVAAPWKQLLLDALDFNAHLKHSSFLQLVCMKLTLSPSLFVICIEVRVFDDLFAFFFFGWWCFRQQQVVTVDLRTAPSFSGILSVPQPSLCITVNLI